MSGEEPEPASRRGALAALVLMVVLIVVVAFVIGRLRTSSQMQDCLASGRTNCAPIAAPASGG